MSCGLSEQDLSYITTVIGEFDEIEKAAVFGSRAKGTYKIGSDIDIAVVGDKISFTTIARLRYRLQEEGPLPYFVDVVDYTHSTHQELKEHIDRVGRVIFERK